MSDRIVPPGSHESSGVIFSSEQTRRARDLLARLVAARRAAVFYPPGHAVTAQANAELMRVLRMYHDEGVDVPLSFFEHEVLLGDQLLADESVLFDQLIRDMASVGLNSVVFTRGTTQQDIDRAMPVLAADAAAMRKAGGTDAAVRSAGVPSIRMGTVAYAEVEQESQTGAAGAPREAYDEGLTSIREFGRIAADGGTPSVAGVRNAALAIVDRTLDGRDLMLELTVLKDYDDYTFFHSVNVSILSVALGSIITGDRRFLASLGIGALMHDIGKMTVDLAILNKVGPLSPAEWKLMERHPVYGAEFAATLRGLDRSALPVILEHHMRYDLDGYPRRQPPQRQHLMSRIVAIADAYDAMTSHRSYSVARLQDEAMEVLSKNAGTAFDPTLVRLFIQMMGVYPARSVVRLSTGEIAVVVRSTADVLSPYVRVIAAASGELLPPHDVDLSDPATARGRRVESCIDGDKLGIDIDAVIG